MTCLIQIPLSHQDILLCLKTFLHPDASDMARSGQHIFPGHSAATGSHSEVHSPSISPMWVDSSQCDQQVLIHGVLSDQQELRELLWFWQNYRWVGSDLYHALRLFYHLGGGMFTGWKERTAHGTQAAGYFGIEAVDIKAMIDFSAPFL